MIVIHEDFNHIYQSLIEKFVEKPDYKVTNKDGETLYEFINPSITILRPMNCFALCRGMSLNYLKGELEWYYSGSPYKEDITKYSKFWEKLSEDGWSNVSNYGKFLLYDRNVHNYTQFEYVLSCLLKNPESKKAVMVLYNKDHAYKSKDNPCTMYLQFFIRDNELNMFVKMRSSDIWFGMPYDVPFFVSIQYLIYSYLERFGKYKDLKIGRYNHQSGSLHLYERNLIQVQEEIKNYNRKDLSEYEQISLFRTYIEPKVNFFVRNTKIRNFTDLI